MMVMMAIVVQLHLVGLEMVGIPGPRWDVLSEPSCQHNEEKRQMGHGALNNFFGAAAHATDHTCLLMKHNAVMPWYSLSVCVHGRVEHLTSFFLAWAA